MTSRPEVELALTRSYNRWLADKCGQAHGRLRWVCVPPLNSMEKALEELRFAKDNGACGVLKKGDEEAGHWPDDPYFFPLYEEAERLDMPVCFHTGSGGLREFGYESNFLGINQLRTFLEERELTTVGNFNEHAVQPLPARAAQARSRRQHRLQPTAGDQGLLAPAGGAGLDGR